MRTSHVDSQLTILRRNRVREIASVDLEEVYDTSEEESEHRRAFARDANDHNPVDGVGGYVR